ncbi:MAG: hypothetical protein NWR60_08375 [Candidatus Nanopelagicales bacterium]|jgi:nitrogen regulatory protein P-II 2|nr:hypothetical protein [Candidatus Nanopelagicales bacterium]
MSELSEVTCVVIVAEAIVEPRLLDDLVACGVRGWTLTPAQGQGPRNRGVSEIEGGSIRLDVLASDAVVDRIWQLLDSDYFHDYAVSAWSYPVRVMRTDRYR